MTDPNVLAALRASTRYRAALARVRAARAERRENPAGYRLWVVAIAEATTAKAAARAALAGLNRAQRAAVRTGSVA